MSDLSARVRSVIAATFGLSPAQVTDSTDASSIEEWGSMNHLHLLVAIEAEFGVSFEPEQAVELMSVKALEEALSQLGVR
jgi:acyl carrier protein